VISPFSYSIRRQLLFLTGSLLLTLLVISYLATDLYSKRAARLSYDRLMTGAALQIAENIRLQDGEVVVDLPQAAFKTLSLSPNDRAFYAIREAGGRLITGYDKLPTRSDNKGNNLLNNSVAPFEHTFYNADFLSAQVRFIVIRNRYNDVNSTRDIEITLGQTLQARQELAHEIRWQALQFVAAFFIIAITVALVAIRLILTPLSQLNEAIQQRSPVDLSPLRLDVPAEVSPLTETINHFMLQLGSTLDRLKRFTSEAAHQLRTPLAGLKSQAQNALEETDETHRREQLIRIVQCSDMLSDTVSQLLIRAELTHRFQRQSFNVLRLDRLIQDVCRDVALTALHNGVELAYLGRLNISVKGDDFSLKQMLRNILENAIKYSPAGGTVEVDLTATSSGFRSGALLRVRDQGPGIPDEEKKQVFEQFYRSVDNPRAGSGLGLAMVREIALHHHARLSLKDNAPTGLVVDVHFTRVIEA